MIAVRRATRADHPTVVAVMAEAFDDDPVSRWLVPSGSLAPLFRAHLRSADPAYQHVDLAELDGRPVGAAIWHAPGHRPGVGRQLSSLLRYAVVLRGNLGRGASLEGLMHRARPHQELWYLAGVGAVVRGQGVGTSLLDHRLATVSGAAYLESSKRENIPLYERFGFEVRESLQPPGGPELWPMLRPAPGTSAGTPPG